MEAWKGRRAKYLLWAAAAVLVMAAVYMYTHRDKTGPQAKALPPLVKVETLAKKDMEKRVVLSGETVPLAEVDISAKYAGRIAEILVDLGDTVRAGDVLIRQDTGDLDISILENTAGREEAAASAVESRAAYGGDRMKAESDFENAKATYERYQSLYDQGAVALQDRDDKYRAMMEAKAALESLTSQQMGRLPAVVAAKVAAAEKARYTVAALEQKRDDMTIRAPSAGRIGYRKAEVGEWASAGEKLLSIVDNSVLYLDCAVAEQDIGAIREGMRLPVSIDSLGISADGVIRYISPAMDEATRSYIVRLVLEKPDAAVRGGMFGRAEVTSAIRRDTLFVPKEAIGDDNGKKYIFLIDDEGKAHRSYVKLGLINDDSVELLSGAKASDRAAVTNIARLREGVAVETE